MIYMMNYFKMDCFGNRLPRSDNKDNVIASAQSAKQSAVFAVIVSNNKQSNLVLFLSKASTNNTKQFIVFSVIARHFVPKQSIKKRKRNK